MKVKNKDKSRGPSERSAINHHSASGDGRADVSASAGAVGLKYTEGPSSNPSAAATAPSRRGRHGRPRDQTRSFVAGWPGALWVAGSAAILLFVWAFWHTFVGLWRVWQTNADYSAGQLVPLAAAYMVISRRKRLKEVACTPALIGFLVFAAGLALNVFGRYYLFSSLENVGMVICANGLVVALGGWGAYRTFWYPILFLFLMIPPPGRVHDAIMLPLQSVAAQISAIVLEILGVAVERAGHVLDVAGRRIAVAEACNGLRMALAFLLVAGVVAYVIRRPKWQRAVVLISSVAIALACNVFRIVVTACLYVAGYDWVAKGVFHDGMGLLMMPAALLLVLAEVWLLSKYVGASRVSRVPASNPARSRSRPRMA